MLKFYCGNFLCRADFYIILFFCLFVAFGCSQDDGKVTDREIESYYRVGMFDAVLDLSRDDNRYRGMIYEYGLMGPKDISSAKKVYENIDDSFESNKRLFFLCFLYCVDDVDGYFSQVKEDNMVLSIYSLLLLVEDGECKSKIKNEICNYLSEYYKKNKENDVYYSLGFETYKVMFEERKNKEDFQYPYYLLMKSYLNGNKKAKDFLDLVPDRFSWVPK